MPHPLPVIAGAYYAIVKANADGRPVSNVFCFQKAGLSLGDSTDAANSGDVATAVGVRWHFVSDLLADNYVAYEVACYPLGSPLLPAFISSISLTGGLTGAQTMKQVAALVHHTVFRRGKGSQGRTFLSPLTPATVDADFENLTGSYQTNLQAGFSSFITNTLADITAASPGTWTYMQLSKKGTGAVYPIVNSSVKLPVAGISRRLGR